MAPKSPNAPSSVKFHANCCLRKAKTRLLRPNQHSVACQFPAGGFEAIVRTAGKRRKIRHKSERQLIYKLNRIRALKNKTRYRHNLLNAFVPIMCAANLGENSDQEDHIKRIVRKKGRELQDDEEYI